MEILEGYDILMLFGYSFQYFVGINVQFTFNVEFIKNEDIEYETSGFCGIVILKLGLLLTCIKVGYVQRKLNLDDVVMGLMFY